MTELKQQKKNSEDSNFNAWRKVLKTSLMIPGVRVNRETYLRSQLKSKFSSEIVEKAIQTRPATAGISLTDIDSISFGSIGMHVIGVSSISFAAGLPGGWWMAATIPGDLAQFYWHALVLSQKLAYLYGWPSFFDKDDEIDDETILRLTLFIGVMMGAAGANSIMVDLSKQFAGQIAKKLPQQALTKYGFYNLTKQVGKWIGVGITKQSFARGISKVIPIIGGGFSAALSAAIFIPMSNNLKNHLRTLIFCKE